MELDNDCSVRTNDEESLRMSHDGENSFRSNMIPMLSGEFSTCSGSDSENPVGKCESNDNTVSGSTSIDDSSTLVTKRAEQRLPVGPGEVALRFIFANHDGVNVKIVFPLSSTVLSIKTLLLSSWPQGVRIAESPSQLRFISMGRILLDDVTLELYNLDSYDNYVPINVSLKPRFDSLGGIATRKKCESSSWCCDPCTIS